MGDASPSHNRWRIPSTLNATPQSPHRQEDANHVPCDSRKNPHREEQNGIRMGRVQFGGITRETCLDLVPEACVGDYVIVHVGFAISRSIEKRPSARTKCWNRWVYSRTSWK